MAIITMKMILVRRAEFGLVGRAQSHKNYLTNRRRNKPKGANGTAAAWTGPIHQTPFNVNDQMIKKEGPGTEEDAVQTPVAGQPMQFALELSLTANG